MTTVLGLGTFPIRLPIHGGQRRVDAFRQFYARNGVKYEYIAVYDPAGYSQSTVFKSDVPYKPCDDVFSKLPYMMDVDAGEYAARDEAVYRHFVDLVQNMKPAAVQLEHPFMWPVVRRLQQAGLLADVPLIYSSHNFEAPLKETMLVNAGISRRVSSDIRKHIHQLEEEVVSRSALTVVVSPRDADAYNSFCCGGPIVVVRNGVTSTPPQSWPQFNKDGFAGKYLLFVGSAYLPNTQGFQHFVLRDGLFFLPPEKTFAVCGGVSEGVYKSEAYLANHESYSRRVQFFPEITDGHLAWVRDNAHVVVLPIKDGGGSNLKTAEALVSGNWIVASKKALRSFEEFGSDPGVLTADTPSQFAEAMVYAYHQSKLELNETQKNRRRQLYWENCFDGSTLSKAILSLLPLTSRDLSAAQ